MARFSDAREAAVQAAMQKMMGLADEPDTPPKPKDVQARILKDMLPLVLKPSDLKVGDLIEQLPAFARYKYPGPDELAIVTDVGSFRDAGSDDSDNTVSRLDIRILVFARDTWAEFYVESWRFKSYDGLIA